MKRLLFTKPVYKETIWGGDRLRKEFSYPIPGERTGECWAISAHPAGDCEVCAPGTPYDGRLLSELWEHEPQLFGFVNGDRFPLLVKIIDAADDLSIQVHPDDAYAKEHENGSLGKTECWYILACDPGATIVIGHNAASKEEARAMIEEKRWNDFIREVPIRPGDFFLIKPGTVHAIKRGTMLLETQESSDLTYRLYDYDRLQNGKPRQLHIEKSLDVIQAPFDPQTCSFPELKTIQTGNSEITRLVDCECFTVDRIVVKNEGIPAVLNTRGRFINMSVIDGAGTIDDTPIRKGDHFIIPAGYGCYDLHGEMTLIASHLPYDADAKERYFGKCIDLHVHSNESDGTLTPTQVVEQAAQAGLYAIALTDHDTVSGVAEAVEAGRKYGVRVIPGIEISSARNGGDVHILGYGVNVNQPEFLEELDKIRNIRIERNRKMAKLLEDHGFAITYEKLMAKFGEDAIITRAHFARYLLDTDQIGSVSEAFDKYIGPGCPCYLPKEEITIERAMAILRMAGARPVLAHPMLYKLSKDELEELVDRLIELGLYGIEAVYTTYLTEEENYVKRLARRKGLVITGGSDFHGANKPKIAIGKGFGGLYVPADLLEDLNLPEE